MDDATLESIVRLTELPHWERLKAEALTKIGRVERSLTKLLFTTSVEVDPIRVEYDRGFRQGVMYVLEGLPNQAKAELLRRATTEEDDH